MKITKFIDFILDYERKVFIILFVLFSVGFIYGCCFNLQNFAGDVDYINIRTDSAQLWINIVLRDVCCLIVTFILGYTVIGFPLLYFNVVIFGMYPGILISRFILLYGLKGALIFGIAFFPYLFNFTTSFILMSFSSMRMSVALFNVFKKGTRFISPKTYSIPHMVKLFVFLFVNFVFSFVFAYLIYPIINKIL